MGHRLMFLVALVLTFALTAAASDTKKAEKETTVKGEVVGVSCYLATGARGEGHKGCAEACAKAGGPLGILTSTGKLYVSVMPDSHETGPNALLMDHIAQVVEARGIIRSKGGVNGIMITSVTPVKK